MLLVKQTSWSLYFSFIEVFVSCCFYLKNKTCFFVVGRRRFLNVTKSWLILVHKKMNNVSLWLIDDVFLTTKKQTVGQIRWRLLSDVFCVTLLITKIVRVYQSDVLISGHNIYTSVVVKNVWAYLKIVSSLTSLHGD